MAKKIAAQLLALVAAVLAVMIAVNALQQYATGKEIADVEIKLETSRGREEKQTAELMRVQEQIPVVKAALEEKQPLADEAKAEEESLRQERKRLKSEIAEMEKQQGGEN